MAGAAPTEQEILNKTPGKVMEFTDHHQPQLANKVTAELQKDQPNEEATIPAADQPVPDHPALKSVGAERVGAEPDSSLADLTHNITRDVGTLLGGEGLHSHTRIIHNKHIPGKILDRVRKISSLDKAA